MKRQKLVTEYLIYPTIDSLPPQYSKLMVRAKKSLSDSYSPYSDYRVGAALALSNAEILTGANQENAAYPMCLCAERTALAAASAIYPQAAPVAMAIATAPASSPATPCGACRQVLSEYEQRYEKAIALIIQAGSGPVLVFDSAATLLPLAFGREDLERQ